MSLHIVFSNRIECLEKLLLEDLARIPADPFEALHVVVPGTAMSRHLQLAIADNMGVCTNIRFSYLGNWLWTLAKIVNVNVPDRSPVDPEIMVWLILRILQDGKLASYERLSAFLQHSDELMRFEFARSLSRVFDHYATYRPDWLMIWNEGKKVPDFQGHPTDEAYEEWQSEIWRAVTKELGLGSTHPLQTFLEQITLKGSLSIDCGLPQRAAIFALPVIPPIYLRTLSKLSEIMDINLYMMNPCREYWFDIVSPKRLAYLQSVKRDAYKEIGNLLLADWGRATQSAIDLVYEEATAAQTLETTSFIEPAGKTLLAQLQKSILNMEELKNGSVQMSETDRSIEIHCCHGTVRELDVLHDRLLELFAQDETLRADEVVVLAPAIDDVAPSIDAVFGTVPRGHLIPYAITGRAAVHTNPFLMVLLDLLDLMSSRMPASRVFDLLRQPPVTSRFGLDNEGLMRIRTWLSRAGICWGLDGEHRKKMGLSGEDHHTFRRGLDSLMFSVALSRMEEPLAGYLPCDNLEGSRAETLGQLWLFIERLKVWRNRLDCARPAGDWQGILNRMLVDFTMGDGDTHAEYDRLVSTIAELADNWRAAGLTQKISARVVRAALADSDTMRRGSVPSGKVTFASLSAMRGLGYRVVCLIGMNDNAYPGQDQRPEYDLIPRGKPRRGDRQRRLEDRGVFLDALLAAGEYVHISYAGRDQRDNSAKPPSVLVAQLMDYLGAAIAPENPTPDDLKEARSRLTVIHPLQPFSRKYFDGLNPRLVSHVSQYAVALNTPAAGQEVDIKTDSKNDEDEDDVFESAPPFFNGMPASKDEYETESPLVTMEDLFSFLSNPSRFFLQRQLQIYLSKTENVIVDEEPLVLNFEKERDLAQVIVEACLARNSVLKREEAYALVRALPQAPPGAACEAGLSEIWPKISSLAARLISSTTEPKLPPKHSIIDIKVHDRVWQLKVDWGELRSGGLIHYRCDELRAYDSLRAWVQHLMLCASPPEGVSLKTKHFAFDRDLTFEAISRDEAGQYLADLIHLYHDGFKEPVPFFRKSAWEYMDKDENAAINKWRGGYNMRGESESHDIWHSLAWRGVADPLDKKFSDIARRVYEPLIKHMQIEDVDIPEE